LYFGANRNAIIAFSLDFESFYIRYQIRLVHDYAFLMCKQQTHTVQSFKGQVQCFS